MSRLIDTDLINARVREREDIVSQGKFIEEIEANGKSPEQLIKDAKEVLGIEDKELIMLKFTDKLAEQNLQTKAFCSLANFTSKVEGTGLISDEELETIKAIEAKIALVMGSRFGIELDELYTWRSNNDCYTEYCNCTIKYCNIKIK